MCSERDREERILGGHRLAARIASSSLFCVSATDDVLVAGIFEDVDRALGLAVGDRGDPHAGNAVRRSDWSGPGP